MNSRVMSSGCVAWARRGHGVGVRGARGVTRGHVDAVETASEPCNRNAPVGTEVLYPAWFALLTSDRYLRGE